MRKEGFEPSTYTVCSRIERCERLTSLIVINQRCRHTELDHSRVRDKFFDIQIELIILKSYQYNLRDSLDSVTLY